MAGYHPTLLAECVFLLGVVVCWWFYGRMKLRSVASFVSFSLRHWDLVWDADFSSSTRFVRLLFSLHLSVIYLLAVILASLMTDESMTLIITWLLIVCQLLAIARYRGLLRMYLSRAGNSFIRQMNSGLQRIDELKSAEEQIELLYKYFSVNRESQIQTEIKSFVNDHKVELASDVRPLASLIDERVMGANEELSHLRQSHDIYEAAMTLYIQAASEVNRTRDDDLKCHLKCIHVEGLMSEDLRTLIEKGKWDAFLDIVQSIVTDLRQLHRTARTLRWSNAGGSLSDIPEETEEQKAYRILAVHPGATPDNIKLMYRSLARVYHSDTSTLEGDEKMKEINWAYGFLKKKIGFN